MKIIALRGVKNSGKSHVINIVYQFLLSDDWVQLPGNFRILGNPVFDDVIDVLKKEDLLIGIIGAGDYQVGSLGLKNLIKELDDKHCDIIVCACRTNLKIEVAITHYRYYDWVDKTLSNGRENDRTTNNIDAKKIITLISQTI